jgi:hypothetical protein
MFIGQATTVGFGAPPISDVTNLRENQRNDPKLAPNIIPNRVLVQTRAEEMGLRFNVFRGSQAARTAAQISGAVAGLPGNFPILNWSFLIFSASSMAR